MVIEDTRVSPRRQSIALIFVSIFCFFLFGSVVICCFFFFFFSSRRRHTRSTREWSSDVCSSDLGSKGCGMFRDPEAYREFACLFPLGVQSLNIFSVRSSIGRRESHAILARSWCASERIMKEV